MSRSLWRLVVLAVASALVLGGCRQGAIRPDDQDTLGALGESQLSSPADVYVQLAAEYMHEGQIAEALKNAKKAVMVDPNRSSAHNVLGILYQRLGEKALAEKAFMQATKLDPRDPYVLNAYGSFLCAERRFSDADEMFQRAVMNPLYSTPWIALTNAGVCARRAGATAQAETHLRRALRANKRFAPALLAMANISMAQDNPLSARAYLQRYAEVAAHTSESLWLGIQAEDALGDRDQAASYALLLQSRFPDSEQVKLLRESRSP